MLSFATDIQQRLNLVILTIVSFCSSQDLKVYFLSSINVREIVGCSIDLKNVVFSFILEYCFFVCFLKFCVECLLYEWFFFIVTITICSFENLFFSQYRSQRDAFYFIDLLLFRPLFYILIKPQSATCCGTRPVFIFVYVVFILIFFLLF